MTIRKNLLELDGSQGEGGGQILRSALSLSMWLGRPFRIERIRAGRAKPGLMRQHLTCIRAAEAVCGADVEGAEIGSTTVVFRPGPIRGGNYAFKVGSAGSVMLVLQTILPALLTADTASTVHIEGGTHTFAAPATDFVEHAYLPVLRGMGADVSMHVEQHGFFPAGGGRVCVTVKPSSLSPLALFERGEDQGIEAVALLRNLPTHVAERELDIVQRRLRVKGRIHELPSGFGPGNAVVLRARHAAITEVAVSLGSHGVSAETVANRACDELRSYLAHGAPVGEHLADQLLLPMLLGGGAFVTGRPSTHLETNAAVIEAFDAGRVHIAPDGSDAQRRYRVTVASGL